MTKMQEALAKVESPLVRMNNWLMQVNRGLQHEVDMLKVENKTLKDQAILIHERKVAVLTEKTVFMGRL